MTSAHASMDSGRNFDARPTPAELKASSGLQPESRATQLRALESLRQEIPELSAELNLASGTVRTLYNRVGFLTAPAHGDASAVAMAFVRDHLAALGLNPSDLEDFEVTDSVYSKVTGATHIYLRQRHQGIPVYNGQLHININRDGQIISVNNAFVTDIASLAREHRPALEAIDAVAAAAEHLGLTLTSEPRLSRATSPNSSSQLVEPHGISEKPIETRLMWLPISPREVRLVWNLAIFTLDQNHAYDMTVDAETGQTWTRFDWVSDAQYRVYEQPVESPNHTSPLPPSDARTLVVNPEDATASPNGWHDTGSTSFTIMRGNNAHAYEDSNASNSPPGNQPSCGASLDCDFPIDLSANPNTHIPATLANMFYWTNLLHDIQYQYGFDEAAGNFQVNNFGRGGSGNDDVRAEAQDGSGTCNANFSTPPDGSRARMQMFLCPNTSPSRDSALDNATVVHEYGHGISIRQVGGPGNSSCLSNRQQPGEGWSDWFDQVYTIEVGDQGTDRRPDGTYFIGQAADGPGIRPQPYSTDPAINNYTYESINGLAVPHGVGSVWAQALVEVNWALIDQYGFDPDFYDVAAGAGNHRSMLYVNEGFKNTACSPTFTQARDGIIQAAADNFGGADVCLIWQAFADFGLGSNAVSGGSGSTNPTNGFSVPAACACSPQAVADAGPDQAITAGQSVTLGTPSQTGHTYSWSPGGATSAQISVSPTSTTTYTVTATTTCGSSSDSVTVTVIPAGCAAFENFDSGAGGWTNSPSSTCSTGTFVVGTPSQQTSSGVTTQVGGDHTSGSGSAFFSATNTAAGANDVDGGTCIVESPVYSVSESSDVSIWYFHGQRDAGDDAGDLFNLEISTNGGTSYSSIASVGDVTLNAAWTEATTTVAAGTQVKFRVSVADATGGGDIVEAGIDDLQICANGGPGNTAPTVDITTPANGSSSTEGDSVNFTGTASDTEDGNISGSLSWNSSLDGNIGSGASFSTSTLSVGSHTITSSVTDSGGLSANDSISITVNPDTGGSCPAGSINFNSLALTSYSNQNTSNATQVLDGGDTLQVTGNTWVRSTQTFAVTANTVIEFDFTGTVQGEIHAIGFDEDDDLNNAARHFQFWGTQNWTGGGKIDFNPKYTAAGAAQSFSVPVGQSYTGNMFLVFTSDDDANAASDTRFSCVRIVEDTPPPGCVTTDFSSGASGWTNTAASTCSTGAFVVGTPTAQTNGGVTTQVGGDHTSGTGNAFFSATNTSAGSNDVDGGTCVVESGTTTVAEASDVSIWYFHGQRDGGDDAGDFFSLEISTNGGSTWSTLASAGDVVSNAAWTEATTSVAAGSQVRFRVQVADGTAGGDLIEAGIDDVEFCPVVP